MNAGAFDPPRSPLSSPIGSQVKNTPDASSLTMENVSQLAFATQMPISVSERRPIQPEVQTRVPAHAITDNLAKYLVESEQKLQRKTEVFQDHSTRKDIGRRGSYNPPPLSQVTGEGALQIASRLDSISNIRQSQSSQTSHSSRDSKPRLPPRDDVVPTTGLIAVINGSGGSNGRGSVGRSLAPGHTSDAPEDVCTDTLGLEEEQRNSVQLFVDPFNIGNPFEGRKRVPIRFVRIPRDQQQLLDRSDAWFTPATSPYHTYATIPIPVREHLITFASRAVQENIDAANSDLDLGSDRAESDSDSEVGSGNSFVSADQEARKQISLSNSPMNSSALSTPIPDGTSNNAMSTEGEAQWTPSPEHHKHHTIATLGLIPPPTFESSLSSEVQVCGAGVDANVSTFPNSSSLANQEDPLYVPRILEVVYPSSSEVELDLDQDELHAVGDRVANEEGKVVQVPETSQDIPCIAARRTEGVEVKQSPLEDSGVVNFSGERAACIKIVKAEGGDVSSDAVIPATCGDLTQPGQLSKAKISGDIEKTLPSGQSGLGINTSIFVEGEDKIADFDGCVAISGVEQHVKDDSSQAPIDFPSSPPVLADFSFSRERSDQPWSASRRKSRASVSTGNSTPRRPSVQTDDILSQTSILNKPYEGAQSPQSSTSSVQEMPRHADTSVSRANNDNTSTKRRRHKAAAAAILQEESVMKDIREMVRAGRHQFNTNLPANISNEKGLLPQSQPLPLKERFCQPNQQNAVSPQHEPKLVEASTPQVFVPSQQSVNSAIENEPPRFATVLQEKNVPEAAESYQSTTAPSPPNRQINSYLAPSRSDSTPHTNSLLEQDQMDGTPALDCYHHFTSTYPNYSGSRNNFTWALVYIEWLRKAKQLLHRSLCDDFIRVISSDYVDYVKTTQGKAMTGWQYYDQKVQVQEYSFQIVTPENLQEALRTLDQHQVEKIRSQFEQPHESNTSQSEGSGMITWTQNQVASPPAYKGHQHPNVLTSSVNKSARRLPWVKEAKPSSSINKSASSTARGSPPSSVQRKSQALLKAPTIFSNRHESSSASPEYAGSVENRGTSASPILGSHPTVSGSRWRQAIENVQRDEEMKQQKREQKKKSEEIEKEQEGECREEEAHAFKEARWKPESNVGKRKNDERPGNMSQPPKRPRTGSHTIPIATPTPQRSSRPAPKSTLTSAAGSSNPSHALVDGVSKVNSWLNKPQLKRTSGSFEDFVRRRRESGGFSSRASTPVSTPGKRLCTKPKAVSMVQRGMMEPETQPWSY